MKKLSPSTIAIAIIAIASLHFSACKKTIEIEEPVHLITTDAVFSNDKTATSALVGIYSDMMRLRYFFASGAMTIYPGMSADELYSSLPNTQRDVFRENNLESTNGTIRNEIWRFGYSFIYRANACLEGLKTSNLVTPALKNQLNGEALFIRAFCHFYLANLFGDVPLITSSDYRVNANMPRIALTEVYKQIISDLISASSLMTAAYASPGKVRPNKWAAMALLARVYLYQQDWQKAEEAADALLNASAYNLLPDLSKVFLSNSNEAIWQLMPVLPNSGNNTHEGFLFVPFNTSSVPALRLTDELVAAFEAGDSRSTWVGKNTVNGVDYYFPLKYKIASNAPAAPLEYNMVLRLAEQYLIRAEARAKQGNIEGALSDLNLIRTRAGLPNLVLSELGPLLLAIEQERRIELFAEWGHRWFDLKRTGRANDVLSVVKGNNWQAYDALYPIPIGEILINGNLTQNPGY